MAGPSEASALPSAVMVDESVAQPAPDNAAAPPNAMPPGCEGGLSSQGSHHNDLQPSWSQNAHGQEGQESAVAGPSRHDLGKGDAYKSTVKLHHNHTFIADMVEQLPKAQGRSMQAVHILCTKIAPDAVHD